MANKINTPKKLFLSFVMSWAIVLLAACSGNVVNAKNAASVELIIEGLDSLQFTPDSPSIPAAAKVDLTFRNAGNLDHNLIIADGELDLFDLSEAHALAGISTGIVPGGEITTLSFKAPPAGIYKFVCVVPGHAAAGMTGTLTVTEP